MRTCFHAALVVPVLFLGWIRAQAAEPFRFVAIGDSGSGTADQGRVAEQMWDWRKEHPFRLVLMLGDNIYGSTELKGGGNPQRFPGEFDKFYKRFLDQSVRFHAVLGNHDMQTAHGKYEIEDLRRFGIESPTGYYEFTSTRGLVDFFALNTQLSGSAMRKQVEWLRTKLAASKAPWKVVFMHEPLYTPPGRHGPDRVLRQAIEGTLRRGGVQLVLAGHNHFYARMKPIGGIQYVISGGGGRHLYRPAMDPCTKSVREQFHFVAFEVYPDRIHLSAVDENGKVFDEATLDEKSLAAPATGCPATSSITGPGRDPASSRRPSNAKIVGTKLRLS